MALEGLESNAGSPTGESQTVNSSRKQLWELLSADWPSRGPGPISWQQSYNRFLQEEGVDVEMQTRASLLQLWTTQVRRLDDKWESDPRLESRAPSHTHPAPFEFLRLNVLTVPSVRSHQFHSAGEFYT